MQTLNLGILAHVDAGKTSLTERILFQSGVIGKLGSVDSGSTQTDSLALERQRGITIRSAVVSFPLDGVTVNLIDTPGHPDFIAEVERILELLDGAIVVVSAVEGVQAQTRVLVRALRRLSVPFLVFVNKIDRLGADFDRVLRDMAAQLEVRPLVMASAAGAGSKAAEALAADIGDEAFQAVLRDVLSQGDDALLAQYVQSPESLTAERLRQALCAQVRLGLVQPVFCGSAATGAGIGPLMGAIVGLLPSRLADAEGPVSGRVFKIERGWGGEKLCYVHLEAGTLHLRRFVDLPAGPARVTGIELFQDGVVTPARALEAGCIGRIGGLSGARIGDRIGLGAVSAGRRHFAPPTLETRVLPEKPSEGAALWLALSQLSEQDPLIALRKSEDGEKLYVSLYGEVQKEVIQAMLLADHGLAARFEESTVICVERLAGHGAAMEVIFREPNPYLATVGLRVAPAPEGHGTRVTFEVDLGQMPTGFYRTIEEAVSETLGQGMHGWQVVDCEIVVTAVQQSSPSTTAGDFRQLTPLVLAAAIAEAGTVVCEPYDRFRIDIPASVMSTILALLGRAGAATTHSEIVDGHARLEGTIAASKVHAFQQQLPGLTSGAGVMECVFDRYAPVTGPIPGRPRIGADPFNRSEYLLRVRRNLNVGAGSAE
jgi:ribosomal protection tetracycline resistance protein